MSQSRLIHIVLSLSERAADGGNWELAEKLFSKAVAMYEKMVEEDQCRL